ncbi:kinase-associated lipoprotein B [Peribacillus sp. RS7]|jgi:kinase-associated protein B|uniref:kinase-associated lipoprotein B n=1 Tax=Peribacillus TaxID=2675229 RepID=UPI0025A13BA1|nr:MULTISPECIES: kinase-associated lipoprotein B [unclassified Peribacillus]MDM5210421.1 kinase-associated lipoprotein B [Peribacillus sp. NJ4]MDM5220706.1 kinase-associated lipoprotein B [Peribacillus sp. NJ11]MDM5361041.1 kinase-associated lipoprotein B [Peribacillus sp. ACCC06369]
MSEQDFKIGDKVTAIYKTGKYIGEITDIRPAAYLVKVLAVLKHPMQGDLHNPKQTEVSMFHQRRALAFREQTNVPKNMVRIFEEEIPEYKESLREAVEKMKRTLSEAHTEWNDKSLQLLEDLAADYFK